METTSGRALTASGPWSPQQAESAVRLVRALVHTRFTNVPQHVAEYEDLVQIGVLAVLAAADSYDETRAEWATFVIVKARWAIQEHLRSCPFGGRWHHDEFTMRSLDEPAARTKGPERDRIVTLGDMVEAPELPESDPVLIRDVRRRVSRLSEREQIVYRLVAERDMLQRDVASLLGVSEFRVSQHMRAVREALAPVLK